MHSLKYRNFFSASSRLWIMVNLRRLRPILLAHCGQETRLVNSPNTPSGRSRYGGGGLRSVTAVQGSAMTAATPHSHVPTFRCLAERRIHKQNKRKPAETGAETGTEAVLLRNPYIHTERKGREKKQKQSCSFHSTLG